MIAAKAHPATVMDRDGIMLLLEPLTGAVARLQHLWLDAGYTGRGKGKDWVERELGWTAEIVRHPPTPRGVWAPADAVIDWAAILPAGFRVLPKRWVIERTFAWLSRSRRLSKDDEWLCATSEALIYLAMTPILLRRLERPMSSCQTVSQATRADQDVAIWIDPPSHGRSTSPQAVIASAWLRLAHALSAMRAGSASAWDPRKTKRRSMRSATTIGRTTVVGQEITMGLFPAGARGTAGDQALVPLPDAGHGLVLCSGQAPVPGTARLAIAPAVWPEPRDGHACLRSGSQADGSVLGTDRVGIVSC